MKIKIIFSLLICLLVKPSFLFSQLALTVGPEIIHKKNLHLYRVTGATDSAVFSIWLDTNGEKGNDEYYIEKYSLPSFNLEFSKRLFVGIEKGDEAVIERTEIIGDKIVIISSFLRAQKYEFYGQVLDLSGNTIRPITTIKAEERDRYTSFSLSFNSNSEYVILNTHHFEERIHSDKVEVFSMLNFASVFERDLRETNLDEEKTFYYGFKYEEKGLFHYISSSTAVKTIDKKKVKTTELSLCYYNLSDAKENKVLINESKLGNLGAINIYDESLEKFIIGGYRSETENDKDPMNDKLVAFYATIDPVTGTIKQTNETSLPLAGDKMKWSLRYKLEKQDIGFYTKSIYYSKGTIWLAGEQQAVISTNFLNVFYYDLVVSHFDLNTNVMGITNFPKREFLDNQTLSNYSPSNFLFSKNQDEMKILYLDSPKNLKTMSNSSFDIDDLEDVEVHKNSTLVVGSINKKNEVIRNTSSESIADQLHLRCKVTPHSSQYKRNPILCDIYKKDQLLVYFYNGKIGHWALVKNF